MFISLDNALYSYQKKIGSYDKQQWEKTIEERIIKGLDAIPKKVAKVKTELIDLDLIRGSALTKAKPQHGWLSATYSGINRVLLFPFYLNFWSAQTNRCICCVLLFLYILQWISMRIYFENGFTSNEFAEVPTSEVLTPLIMMIALGIIHSQIVGTKINKRKHTPFRDNTTKTTKTTNKINTSNTTSTTSTTNNTTNNPIHNTTNNTTNTINNTINNSINKETSGINNEKNFKIKKRVRKSKHMLEQQSMTKNGSDEESGLGDVDLTNENKTKQTLKTRRKFVADKLNLNNPNNNFKRLTIPRINIRNPGKQTDSSDDDTPSHCHWRRYSDSRQFNSSDSRQFNSSDSRHLFNNSDSRHLFGSSDSRQFFANTTTTCQVDSEYVTRRNSEGSGEPIIIEDKLKNLKKRKNVQVLHLSPNSYLQNNCCSSCDSEETMFPQTPNTPTPGIGISDLDWPINSDGSYSDEDSHQETTSPPSSKYFIYPDLCEPEPPLSLFNEQGREETNELKVSCAIWQQNECQKVDLSVVDISSAIVKKVDSIKHSSEYLILGIIFSIILALLPGLFRLQQNGIAATTAQSNMSEIVDLLNFPALDLSFIAECLFGSSWRVRFVVIVAMLQRMTFSMFYFFLLCVAERAYREKFFYAKYFSQITRRDRAKRSEVPHFRLHKVKNLKVWLSVRSYLRRHGPIRTVGTICSSSFIISVCILTFLCLQLLKESETYSAKLYCWEMVFWNLALGIFIMRLMILGSRINTKYRGNLSILITEQINLYLQLEQKPHKKEELTLANHVLKLAADLLKQLESPYKISGFCANPYLYNITKVVVLSAFSAALTELLGFKLKLHKIKIR